MRLPTDKLGLFLLGFLLCFGTESALAKITLSNDSPLQGQTVELCFVPTTADDEKVVDRPTGPFFLHFNGTSYKLFPFSDAGLKAASQVGWHCLVGIPADLDPRNYKLTIEREDKQLKEDTQPVEEHTIKVQDGKFPVQRLSLPKSKDNFVMAPGEKETVEQAKATLSEQRLWLGSFKPPSQARQSAAFGMKRIVNGRLLKDYFHSGLDFAASLGTPVDACADGKVILAHKGFKLHGNIVAIDHGQGVVSFYIHLQQILVKEGDIVQAGDKIATVGQTGRANGPHLHFSIYVNKVATNPSQWFHTTF